VKSRVSGATESGTTGLICDIQDEKVVVLVLEVGHRKDVYR